MSELERERRIWNAGGHPTTTPAGRSSSHPVSPADPPISSAPISPAIQPLSPSGAPLSAYVDRQSFKWPQAQGKPARLSRKLIIADLSLI